MVRQKSVFPNLKVSPKLLTLKFVDIDFCPTLYCSTRIKPQRQITSIFLNYRIKLIFTVRFYDKWLRLGDIIWNSSSTIPLTQTFNQLLKNNWKINRSWPTDVTKWKLWSEETSSIHRCYQLLFSIRIINQPINCSQIVCLEITFDWWYGVGQNLFQKWVECTKHLR